MMRSRTAIVVTFKAWDGGETLADWVWDPRLEPASQAVKDLTKILEKLEAGATAPRPEAPIVNPPNTDLGGGD